MQQNLFTPDQDFVQPHRNNFETYMKVYGIEGKKFEFFLKNMDSLLEKYTRNDPEYYAIQYAFDSLKEIEKPSSREERKEKCRVYYLRFLEKTNMKKSEIVKKIAKEMNVNKDCIYAYLRELSL